VREVSDRSGSVMIRSDMPDAKASLRYISRSSQVITSIFFYTTENYQQYTMCSGPTNALVCNKTLIQMSHIKTLKITPTCFDHQMIINRELFDPG
jgi:hypothetical protein